MRYQKNETVRIVYEAYRLMTGLTDVKITIWKDTTKVVDAQVCTELAEGIYYYDYTPTEEGTYIYIVDSDSYSRRLTGSFIVGGYADTIKDLKVLLDDKEIWEMIK